MRRAVAALFAPPPRGGAQQLAYRQGTITAFDSVTLENTVDVGGGELFEDLPLLGVAEADTLTVGSVVGLMWTGFEYAIIGRLVRPNTDEAIEAISRLPNSITSAEVATSENTTNTSFTDLTTVGPIVQATVKTSGKLLIVLSADMLAEDTGIASGALMTVQVVDSAGGITYAAGTLRSLKFMYSDSAAHAVGDSLGTSRLFLITGLTPGETYTLTAKYSAESGGANTTFANRNVTAVVL